MSTFQYFYTVNEAEAFSIRLGAAHTGKIWETCLGAVERLEADDQDRSTAVWCVDYLEVHELLGLGKEIAQTKKAKELYSFMVKMYDLLQGEVEEVDEIRLLAKILAKIRQEEYLADVK